MGMEKILSVFLIALTVLGVTGVLLFRYIVADRIMDKSATTNTDYMDGTEPPYHCCKLWRICRCHILRPEI